MLTWLSTFVEYSKIKKGCPFKTASSFLMYYLYIIYSVSSDIYYVGYSDNPERRLAEHNSKPFSTFASKHRPWVLNAVFKCGESESTAIQVERFIKKQKSRNLLEKLCDSTFVPSGFLAQLVRIPDVRD
jgi:putative endonuclease